MKIATRLIFLAGVVLAISACGFHLRGPVNISDDLNPLYVDAEQLKTGEKEMILNALRRAGARLVDTRDGANQLTVSFSEFSWRNLAQSSPTGVQLVQLSLQLTYRVQAGNGDMLVKSRQIAHTSELELDNANVLSHDKLLQSGMRSLQQKLIRSMIYQLKT